jgi:nucleotide-binding universal stress UspA family protein
MSYKTVLVHLDESKRTEERIRIAAQIAMNEDAHLVGVAMTGVSRFIYQSAHIADSDPNLLIHLDFLRERAHGVLEKFEQSAIKLGVSAFEKRLVDDEAGGGVSLQGRYSDLIVIGQYDSDETFPTTLADFPEYVMLHSGRPVLIIPYAGHFQSIAKKVLISWDASREATRAVTDAIPLLKKAHVVQVAVFNPSSTSGEHGEQPGADIALFLARHDINVEAIPQQTDIDIGNALLSLANDLNSDLIVMGGYGHTRFRETILGGVTHTVLKSMTIPVLISH